MNKVLFVLLSLYALPTADLLAAEVTEATPEQQSTLDLPVEVLDATSMYAKALKAGDHVPDDAMKVLCTPHVMRDKRVCDSIIQKIMDVDRSKRIHLPNAIPLFLCEFVTDKTSEVHKMIDDIMIDKMSLNPHIKEHMKHSVGHYYESKEDQWETGFKQVMRDDFRAMAQQYRVLGAIEEDATPEYVQFIVIPDVGDTDDAITNRTKDLDTLFKKHPHLTLVVSFNDDVTQVADYFCYDSSGNRSTLPASIKKLSFTGKNLQTVGKFFFFITDSLTSVDFRGLGALQTVGDLFFLGAHSLTSVNLSGLIALQTVGDFFFYGAHSLTSVNLKGLSALTTVGGSFFCSASALTSVDFKGLSALTAVGRRFFSGAHSLTSVDFRGLSALQTVGGDFFSHAHSLTSLDFRGLSALTTVGNGFFSHAQSLPSVDFSGLSALTTVGNYFFSHAHSLTSVDFRGLGALRTVEILFFSHAHSLTSADFRGMRALTTVGWAFFSDAHSLPSVDLSGLRALTTVGSDFFYSACSLTSLDLRGLGALQTVGRSFFSHTPILNSVSCDTLRQVCWIGNQAGRRFFISDFQHPAITVVP